MLFRFHTGSIKSRKPITANRDTRKGFDSILVRLKADPLADAAANGGFRFHTGSIKRDVHLYSTPRLSAEFRFHTGSIKSRLAFTEHKHILKFRFHTGSIKRRRSIAGSIPNSEFRFHTGSIKRQISRLRKTDSAKVSIPYWFD